MAWKIKNFINESSGLMNRVRCPVNFELNWLEKNIFPSFLKYVDVLNDYSYLWKIVEKKKWHQRNFARPLAMLQLFYALTSQISTFEMNLRVN